MARLGRFPSLKNLFQSAVCLGLMLVTVGSLFVGMLAAVFSDHHSLLNDIKIYGLVAASALVSGMLSLRMIRQSAYHHCDAIALLIIVAAWHLIL